MPWNIHKDLLKCEVKLDILKIYCIASNDRASGSEIWRCLGNCFLEVQKILYISLNETVVGVRFKIWQDMNSSYHPDNVSENPEWKDFSR